MVEQELREELRGLPVFTGDLPRFDVAAAPEDPIELFSTWLRHAISARVSEPHVMTLSTVDASGRPNSRVLILKACVAGRLRFASSHDSVKGQELEASPRAALNFYWREMGRQIRLRGPVVTASRAETKRDFIARSLEARAESSIGRQSEVLVDARELDAALERGFKQVQSNPERVPGGWRLYELEPEEVEFWQADPARRHVRLRYRLEAGRWTSSMLWP